MTDPNGYDWLAQFMEAQASLQAMQFFLTFTLGQLGAIASLDPERAEEMLAKFQIDVQDVIAATNNLGSVCDNIMANVQSNLSKEE